MKRYIIFLLLCTLKQISSAQCLSGMTRMAQILKTGFESGKFKFQKGDAVDRLLQKDDKEDFWKNLQRKIYEHNIKNLSDIKPEIFLETVAETYPLLGNTIGVLSGDNTLCKDLQKTQYEKYFKDRRYNHSPAKTLNSAPSPVIKIPPVSILPELPISPKRTAFNIPYVPLEAKP